MEEREGAADAAASPTVETRRCVRRGRGGHETSGTALRCTARKERGRAYSLVLPCADAHPGPHNTALFPLSRRIYHRTQFSTLSAKKNQRRAQNRHVADLKGVDPLLTRCVRGFFCVYQGERTSPSSAAASSPQMGLTNFSDIPPPEKPGTAGSPLPGNSSSKLSLSRHSCISSLTVVRLGLIYCNFIMCSVYLAMNFFPLVTYTPPLVVCCTRRPLKS